VLQTAIVLHRRRIALIILGCALANFVVFIAIDAAIFHSGFELDREQRQLPYVLIQKGSYRQVSPGFYYVDRVYAYATMLFHIAGMAAGLYLALDRLTGGRPRNSGEMRGAA
jgi:hypothetical protein